MSGEAVPVVAAVVERAGRYLVGRRPAHKRHGGLWEFPGGKLDPGEEPGDGLRRELREELGVEVQTVRGLLWRAPVTDAGFRIDFLAVTLAGRTDPEPLEHEALGWFTARELRGMALAPSDAAFVARLGG